MNFKKLPALLLLLPLFFALPARADDDAAAKRKIATQALEDLRLIDSATDQFAIEHNKSEHTAVTWDDIKPYFKPGSHVYNCNGKDPLGNLYNGGKFSVGDIPQLSPETFKALSSVADAQFWAPYYSAPARADDKPVANRKTAELALEELRLIDSAIDQFAIEHNKSDHTPVTWDDIKTYLKPSSRIYSSGGKDPFGNPYNGGKFIVGDIPKLSPETFKALSTVVDAQYWSPYY